MNQAFFSQNKSNACPLRAWIKLIKDIKVFLLHVATTWFIFVRADFHIRLSIYQEMHMWHIACAEKRTKLFQISDDKCLLTRRVKIYWIVQFIKISFIFRKKNHFFFFKTKNCQSRMCQLFLHIIHITFSLFVAFNKVYINI